MKHANTWQIASTLLCHMRVLVVLALLWLGALAADLRCAPCDHNNPDAGYCTIDADFCDVNPCLNSGLCYDTDTTFVCICPDAYYGPKCQYNYTAPYFWTYTSHDHDVLRLESESLLHSTSPDHLHGHGDSDIQCSDHHPYPGERHDFHEFELILDHE